MLVATMSVIGKRGEELVVTTMLEPVERVSTYIGDICCIGCNKDLFIKDGGERAPHFSHYKSESCGYGDNVPPGHQVAQAMLVNWFRSQAGWRAEPEWRGPDFVADVMATENETGIRLGLELQFSNPKSASNPAERTKRQAAAGIDQTIWLCNRSFSWMPSVPSMGLQCDDYLSPAPEISVSFDTLTDGHGYQALRRGQLPLFKMMELLIARNAKIMHIGKVALGNRFHDGPELLDGQILVQAVPGPVFINRQQYQMDSNRLAASADHTAFTEIDDPVDRDAWRAVAGPAPKAKARQRRLPLQGVSRRYPRTPGNGQTGIDYDENSDQSDILQ
jgi:hypothetical protein